MRRLAILSIFALLWMAFGCAGAQDDDSQVQNNPSSEQNTEESQSAKSNESEQEPWMSQEEEPKEEPAAINLSGNGPTATDPFELKSGLAIFRMSYQGEMNFIVKLLDGNETQPKLGHKPCNVETSPLLALPMGGVRLAEVQSIEDG